MLRLFGVLLLTGLAVTFLSDGLAARAQADARTLLQRYEAGDHEAVAQAFARISNLDDFHNQLTRVAPSWFGAAHDDAAFRRRLIAATFALEAAYAGPRRWADARHLVEWGCEVLRAGVTARAGAPPSPMHMQAYRVWQLASIGIIQSAHDYVFLMGAQRDADAGRRNARDHLSHALQHFPDEPRLFLAFAIAAEYASWGLDASNPTWLERDEVAEPLAPNARMDASAARSLIFGSNVLVPGATATWAGEIPIAAAKTDTLWELVDIFRGKPPVPSGLGGLAPAASIRPDVSVRLGGTYLRLARPDLAEPVLKRALTETKEPYLVYLAHLFLARGFEARGQRNDAAAHYRLALDEIPDAQSAAIPLSALLFTAGRRGEAADIAARSVGRTPLAADPWRLYQSGDARHVPVLIALLRRAQQ